MTPLHTVILLGVVVWGRCTVVSSQEDGGQVESTKLPVSQQAERRMSIDMDDDSLSESSNGMSSYSSVMIHHPVATTHTGQQATSQWTIEDHKPTGFHRNSEVEHSQPQQVTPHSRRHRHHSRGGATAAPNIREEVTEQPESLSTAHTFFRLRGYKGKVATKKEDTTTSQDDSNLGYDNGAGSQYNQASPHGHRQSLPPGMTHDLMNALLSQQPQTFDYGYKSPSRSDDIERENAKHQDIQPTARPSRKPQKKYKNQIQTEAAEKAKKRLNNKNRDSFNVGYSIGFGNPTTSTVTENPSLYESPNDVVLGKPKSHIPKSNYRLHVNGANSVWKEVHPGVEMSEETPRNTPMSITIPESPQYYRTEPEVGLLSGHPGQSVYYINDGIQQDYNVPTTGQATFDHAHALGQSNTFDFSNAVSHPVSPIQSLSSQSKKDSPSNVKSGKNIQSIQFTKQHQQSYHTPIFKNPAAPNSNQAFSYNQYSLDTNIPSSPLSSKSDYNLTPNYSFLKPANNQQSITSTGLAGGYDLSHFMGLGTPVPIQNVYIPGKKDGEGQMVPAIVIPINQLNGFENFGSGVNYAAETSDGFQSFGGDVFNVVPQSIPKESQKFQNAGKYSKPKQHTPRINDNKSFRGGKGGYSGISSHINLSAPEHLDSPRPPRSKHPRADHPRPYSTPPQKIFAPKFSPSDNFRDSPVNLNRSPSNRNARLAHLQSELNTILAEEMYRKNRPNRRHVPPHPPRHQHPKIRLH